MNALLSSILIMLGFGWGIAASIIAASNDKWWPMAAIVVGFIATFTITGCLDMSKKTSDVTGGLCLLLCVVVGGMSLF